MPTATEKTCSHCAAIFACGSDYPDEQCWCEALPHVSLIADKSADCFCPECLAKAITEVTMARKESTETTGRDSVPELTEGEDYYVEGDAVVFTAGYHLRRGYCCENDCRHCPYRNRADDKEGMTPRRSHRAMPSRD